MLLKADMEIDKLAKEFVKNDLDVTFLVPTETALDKSIIDAHSAVRSFLSRNQIYEYFAYEKSEKNYLQAIFIDDNVQEELQISVYRPVTKNGDPRIWPYGIKKHVKAYNTLAISIIDKQLYLFNCSAILNLAATLTALLPNKVASLSFVATELLDKLKFIHNKGFINTVKSGDTGVGMTLEYELGIAANSSTNPDYKGIELKASRVGDKTRKSRNKGQLFSKIPNWKLSNVANAKELIEKRGYIDPNGRSALYHTMSGLKPNSKGLYLDIESESDYLRQMFIDVTNERARPQHDTTWILADIKSALAKKHKETFWVKALHNSDRVNEKFCYSLVEHTKNPMIDKFEVLVETGLITLDYTMHLKESGKVRDHGYLFKIKSDSLELLFPNPNVYELSN
jgi:hypothetical protein